ncbi:MAG: hypothetical protein JWQ38_166 [Flavipsychrobacter sp.]|nr:hypothetical protein [Flavipsychrobacter sp.]
MTDAESGLPVYQATVINNVNQLTATTDEQGHYTIAVNAGDLLSVTFLGYRTLQVRALPGSYQRIELAPLSVQLKEFVVKEATPFQKDSMALATLYSSELNKKEIKTGFSSANGGGISGLIGGPVQKMSKSYKQNKRFKENFKRDIEQKYIDTKYTQALVNSLTNFTRDTLVTFMNLYPMEYAFARAATDLELKMWIRNNYKDYLHKEAIKSVTQKKK